MNEADLKALAEALHTSRKERTARRRLTEANPELTLKEAYRIMRLGVGMRRDEGEVQVGYKMGLTSQAKREQMSIDSPCYGTLTDRMQVASGDTFEVASGIHPKVEPELAFRTSKVLKGRPGREEVLEACDGVCAALEILDSRYEGFKYFNLIDVVADNSSSSHFVLAAGWEPVQGQDFMDLTLRMWVDGALAQEAPSTAISGDPVLSVVQLVAMLDEEGLELPAGSIVLAGAATAAEALRPGLEVTLEIGGMAPVSLRAG